MRVRLTSFGLKCRELRNRYNLVMADQAKGLGVSVAYISAIELGKRPIPSEYTSELAHWMSLPEEDTKMLEELEIGEKRTVELLPKNAHQALLAHEFAEDFGSIPKEGVEFLRACLKTARSARNPASEIRKRAMLASAVFNLDVESTFDVLRIVESKLHIVDRDFFLQVEADQMGQPPIYSDSNGKKVDRFVCSQWFYKEASLQTATSRAQLAHEIAHWILHPHDTHPYSRMPRTGRIVSKSISIELEADAFAAEFLLPIRVVERFDTPEALAKAANVPIGLAKKRFIEIRNLTVAERDEIRLIGLSIRERVKATALPEASNFSLQERAVTQVSQLKNSSKVRSKRQGRRVLQGMTLFEYADLSHESRTRSDSWFKRYGYRG